MLCLLRDSHPTSAAALDIFFKSLDARGDREYHSELQIDNGLKRRAAQGNTALVVRHAQLGSCGEQVDCRPAWS